MISSTTSRSPPTLRGARESLAEAYAEYPARLRPRPSRRGLRDLIMVTVTCSSRSPTSSELPSAASSHVLVDEYQDTTTRSTPSSVTGSSGRRARSLQAKVKPSRPERRGAADSLTPPTPVPGRPSYLWASSVMPTSRHPTRSAGRYDQNITEFEQDYARMATVHILLEHNLPLNRAEQSSPVAATASVVSRNSRT